jgi:hypothetical protein
MNFQTNADERIDLGFVNKCREVFSFLRENGFSEIEATNTLVVYRRHEIFFRVCHDLHSYEIDGVVSAYGKNYSVFELLWHFNIEEAQKYRPFMTSNMSGLSLGLIKLRTIVENHFLDVFHESEDFFSQLDDEREVRISKFSNEVLKAQILPDASEAFRRGEFGKAVRLFSKVEDCLTQTELKKLEYARSKM